MKIIREYPAKSGTAFIRYYEDARIYSVRHTNKELDLVYWTKNKIEAIKHAQFITRY